MAAAARVQAADLDIAPLFAGYERGCEIAGTQAEHLIVWANPDKKGHIASTDALSSIWRNHVGKSIVTDRHDHWFVKVPLRDVRFHGLRVTRLERFNCLLKEVKNAYQKINYQWVKPFRYACS